MSLLKKSVSWLLVGALAGVTGVMSATAAIAQTSDLDPLEGLGTDDDGADLFGDTSNPFELIHRAILAPSMSSDEYQEYQQRLLGNEAESFRLRQQEAMRQQGTGDVVDSDAAAEDSVAGDAL
jgi:hypothetical protein